MRRTLTLAALVLCGSAQAQSPAAFSRMGLGARAVALGPAPFDRFGQGSPFANAALAPFQPAQSVELSTAALAFDRSWSAAIVGAPLAPRAGVAGGIVQGGVGEIDGRDASGFPTTALSASDIAFFVAFGIQPSDRLSAGVGLRIYRSSLVSSVDAPTALGVQVGLAAQLSERVAAGIVADDLFARYEWNASGAGGGSATDNFARRVTAGTTVALGAARADRPRSLVSADVEVAVRRLDGRRPRGTDVLGGGVVQRPDETFAVRVADVSGRVGAEVWPVAPLGLRAGVSRIGEGGLGALRPAAGLALRRRFDELDVRLDVTTAREPYGTALLHMATLRLGL